MIKIGQGVSNSELYFNLKGLDYKKGVYEIFYSNVEQDNNGVVDTSKIYVGIKSVNRMDILQYPVLFTNYSNLEGTAYTDFNTLVSDIGSFLGTEEVASTPTGSLILSGMTNSSFDKTYSQVTNIYGQYGAILDNFTNDGAGETDYKVFSYDDTGVSGKYFVVMNSNVGSIWTVFETSVDPNTFVDGTSLSSTNGEAITLMSELQDGKNVPSSTDSKVSYN